MVKKQNKRQQAVMYDSWSDVPDIAPSQARRPKAIRICKKMPETE